MYSFRNDYSEGAHPKVLQTLMDTNLVQTCGYGLDPYCMKAADLIRDLCQAPDADVHFLVGGTQTNTIVIASLLQQRLEKLTDIPGLLGFLAQLPDYDTELYVNKKSKTDRAVSLEMLRAAIPAVEALESWDKDSVHAGLMALAEKLEVKNAKLLWPVRIALAGQAVTPGGAVEICCLLGKEEALRRLNLGMSRLAAEVEG